MDKLIAAPRDASWWNRPNTSPSLIKKYHVLVRDQQGYFGPACGQIMLHAEDLEMEASHVPAFQRCHRAGCKKLWPKEPDHA